MTQREGKGREGAEPESPGLRGLEEEVRWPWSGWLSGEEEEAGARRKGSVTSGDLSEAASKSTPLPKQAVTLGGAETTPL